MQWEIWEEIKKEDDFRTCHSIKHYEDVEEYKERMLALEEEEE